MQIDPTPCGAPGTGTSDAVFTLAFGVPARSIDALTAEIRAEEAHAQRWQSRYFDTQDERLAARGVFLSLCKRGRDWVQVASSTTADCVRLLVHEVGLGTRRNGAVPCLLPTRHEGTAVGAALRAALGDVVPDEADDATRLVESFAVDATRLARLARGRQSTVELALTSCTITTNDAAMPFMDFELRWVSGSLAEMFALAQDWSARHGLWVSTTSTGEQGSRLAAGRPDGFPTTATAPVIDPIDDGATFLVATLDSCLTQIVGNVGAVGEGAPDRHVIDQLRHGLERIRTALAELSAVAPDIAATWEPVFKRTFHELAAHRGAAALCAPLIQEMRAAGLGYALTSAHPRETRTPGEIVRDPEFQKTLIAVLAYCHALPPPMRPGQGSLKQLRQHFGGELSERHAQVARDAGKLASVASRRRASRHLDHLVRLAAFAGPLYDVRHVDGFLVRCRIAQDAFSVDREHRAGFESLMDDGETGTDVKLARRWLAVRLADDREQCEALLRGAGKAASFWAA